MDKYKIISKQPTLIKNYVLRKIAGREGGEWKSEFLREYMRRIYQIEVGMGSYGCFLNSGFRENDKIGNYCCIAGEVRHMNANHPMDSVSMHPIFYDNRFYGEGNIEALSRTSLEIGHGVWIGFNTIILSKVEKIGNGAVIGAGSIVTRNVEPYTIVAGNPAKVIGKRFNDEEIEKIEKSEWWNLPPEELRKFYFCRKQPAEFYDNIWRYRKDLNCK